MADRQRRTNWQVHESTARALCRGAFVGLGLLPLALCLLWSAQVFLPTYQRQQASRWEQLLSAQIGVPLKIAAVESLAPQRFALHEIRLLHPETNVEIGRARRADVERTGGKWVVSLSEPELEGAELATSWKAFHDWFLCRPRHAAHAAWVGISELTIHEATGPRTLSDLSLDLLPGLDATLMSIQFHHGMDQSQSPKSDNAPPPKLSQLIIKRHHRHEGLKTEMQLRTGASELACSLLAPLSPLVSRLGKEATFSGTIDFDRSGDEWRMRMTNGRLSHIELSRLTADSEAAISGQGDVLFQKLVVAQSGIEAVRGSGEILSGKMTQGFFHACGEHLKVALRETNQVSSYGFDRCEFAIDLHEPSLHFVCAMSDALGLLAERGAERWEEPLPLVNIIAALQSSAPSSGSPSGLPATWLAKQALLWLPLGDEQSRAAQAHLRLSSNQTREP